MENFTVAVSEEVAERLLLKAAEKSISVSKLVGRLLEDHTRPGTEFGRPYEKWKAIQRTPGANATKRMSRDETHQPG
ncbi:MAG: hypothetical protein ABI972_07690 [Acidobacteriota bacterium]